MPPSPLYLSLRNKTYQMDTKNAKLVRHLVLQTSTDTSLCKTFATTIKHHIKCVYAFFLRKAPYSKTLSIDFVKFASSEMQMTSHYTNYNGYQS
jgi:hypothetical protein